MGSAAHLGNLIIWKGVCVASKACREECAQPVFCSFITLLALAACLLSPWFSLLATLAILLAAVLERWLFFAEAQHVVSLFYGAEKA